jgi:hypothetical protein
MQCERLIKMIKSWYMHVRDETMAPARMVSFIEEHADSCDICRLDPDLKEEISRITELVLPESKIPKAVRQKSAEDDEIESDDVEIETDNEKDEVEDEEADEEDSLDEEGEEDVEVDLDDEGEEDVEVDLDDDI